VKDAVQHCDTSWPSVLGYVVALAVVMAWLTVRPGDA
jgi:hypothetical protein